MKKLAFLFVFAFVSVALVSCSNDDGGDAGIVPSAIVDFEGVSLGSVGLGNLTYENVLLGKSQAVDVDGNKVFDDLLFNEDGLSLGSYYNDNAVLGWGDAWGGFAISSNIAKAEKGEYDYSDQFFAYASGGSKFAVGYNLKYDGSPYTYDMPVMVFESPATILSASIANTTKGYHYCKNNPVVGDNDEDMRFELVITGYSGTVKKGEVRVDLARGANVLADWENVELKTLGAVDKVEFSFSTNDMSAGYSNVPAYFCIDNIQLK